MELLYDIREIEQDNIYIYGAGMVAKLLAMEIQATTNIVIRAYAVTQYPCGIDAINGIPIVSIADIPNTAAVVIATLSDSHIEMQRNLTKNHIQYSYAVSEELFRNMRRKYVSKESEQASQKLRLSEMQRLTEEKNWKGLYISDDELFPFSYETEDIEVVTGRQFMEGTYSLKHFKRIAVLLIDWSSDWKYLIRKAFETEAEILLSYRYKYLKLSDFELLEEAKKYGYQLAGQKRFDRDQREFYTEDILFRFQKKLPETLCYDLLCTGCGKCMLECPAGALHMEKDGYGYEKPICDRKRCISCGKCVEGCPVYRNKNSDWGNVSCYSFMAEDHIRSNSSSGGVFGVAADIFLQEGGYVCGAAWNSDFTVSHQIINDIKALPKLQMSKYMKSDIVSVLPSLKELLKQNKRVLFVGCPCQVAAVKSYVGKYKTGLVTMDLVCADAPSHYVFSEYLRENYAEGSIKEIGFRDKETGWRPDVLYVTDQSGRKRFMHMEDLSQRAFHSRLMMAVCCEHCNFITCPREGDLTLGDAWGVVEHAPHLNDGKGTSIVLLNTEKGKKYYKKIEQSAKKSEKTPFEWTWTNRTVDCIKPHIRRDRFYSGLKPLGFNKAVRDALENQYDIGLVGNWSYPNYGSALTYYALYRTLKSMGNSVLMIEWAQDSPWKPYGMAPLFEWEPYENVEIAYPVRNHAEFYNYNQRCRMFVEGSDQLLHPDLYKAFGENADLDWVAPNRKKVGYALSFGCEKITYPESVQRKLAFHLNGFDGISVREDSAVTLMEELFHIQAAQVLDPIFLCERAVYEELAEPYMKRGGETIFAYILDPTEEKLSMLKQAAKEKKLDLCFVPDAAENGAGKAWQKENALPKIPVEKWLAEIINSEFVITDSFHGACISIILQKDFAVIANEKRGSTRFPSLLRQFGLEDRLVWNASEISDSGLLTKSIDYSAVYRILDKKRAESIDWLKRHLEQEHRMHYSQEYVELHERYVQLEKMLYSKMCDV